MIVSNKSSKIEDENLDKQSEKKTLRDFAGIFRLDPDFPQVLADIEARRQELDLEMELYYHQLESQENA